MRLTELAHIGSVKEQYTLFRSRGCNRKEATQKVLRASSSLPQQERLTLWIGLADAQYAKKELSLSVALCGLIALNRLARLHTDITPGDLQRRRKHYTQAPMPTRKPGRPPKVLEENK